MLHSEQFQEGILLDMHATPVFTHANRCIYFWDCTFFQRGHFLPSCSHLPPKEMPMYSSLGTRTRDFALSLLWSGGLCYLGLCCHQNPQAAFLSFVLETCFNLASVHSKENISKYSLKLCSVPPHYNLKKIVLYRGPLCQERCCAMLSFFPGCCACEMMAFALPCHYT